MPFCLFNNVRLSAVTTIVPKHEIRLEDEIEYYGNDIKKVERFKKMTGLGSRRIAPAGATITDLCTQAAEHVFASTGIERNTIDALICLTQSPDYKVPASAFLQHGILGLSEDCAVFDVNLGCSAYVYGLWLAASMLESRACSRILLLVGDVSHRHLNTANRIIAPLFGDAGSASLVEYTPNAGPLSFSLGSNGAGHEAIICPGGGARIPNIPGSPEADAFNAVVADPNGNPWRVGGAGNTWMEGAAVYDFTVSVVPPHLKEHMQRRSVTPDNIDFLVLHQANKQIIQGLAAAAGFAPQQAPWETLGRYGNQAGASIPAVLCDELQQRCTGPSPLTLMLCGYGVGFSWASCIGDFSKLQCCDMIEFEPQSPLTETRERIHYWHQKFAGEQSE